MKNGLLFALVAISLFANMSSIASAVTYYDVRHFAVLNMRLGMTPDGIESALEQTGAKLVPAGEMPSRTNATIRESHVRRQAPPAHL